MFVSGATPPASNSPISYPTIVLGATLLMALGLLSGDYEVASRMAQAASHLQEG